jgi:hypothetical protein
MTDEISLEEADHTSFHLIYLTALNALASDPKAACDAKGNYNTAWEIQDELTSYSYLANSEILDFDSAQRIGMLKLADELKVIPSEAIAPPGANMGSAAGCLLAMQHPAWVPLRMRAKHLLEILGPAIVRNRKFIAAL